jgi:hypothetical protein
MLYLLITDCENDSDCKTKLVCTLRRVPTCHFGECKCKFSSNRGGFQYPKVAN